MAVDLTLELREAIVVRLRADTDLTSLWDDRFYGEKQPSEVVKPFGRYGYDTMAPFDPQCISGGSVDVTIHTYSQEISSDEIKQINKAVIASLDDARFDLDGAGWCYGLTFVRVQTLPDGPDGFHGIIQFTALTGIEG